MKRLLELATICVLPAIVSAPAFAQSNPVVGTWKLNVVRSKYTSGSAPQNLTRTVEAQGDAVKYSYEGTAADGSPIAYGFTVNYDGKDYPVTGSMPGGPDMIAIKRINPHTFEATQKKEGKVVGTAKVEISKDGMVTTVTSKSTNGSGESISYVAVYDKQ